MLIPRIDSIPWFYGSPPAESRRREFERYRCQDYFLADNKESLPEICKKYFASIGAYIFEGAFCKYSVLYFTQYVKLIKPHVQQHPLRKLEINVMPRSRYLTIHGWTPNRAYKCFHFEWIALITLFFCNEMRHLPIKSFIYYLSKAVELLKALLINCEEHFRLINKFQHIHY